MTDLVAQGSSDPVMLTMRGPFRASVGMVTVMSLKVVGAGVGRTGTNSLELALEQLLGGKPERVELDFPYIRSCSAGDAAMV
jgi:Sulfotransferase domain